MRKVNQENIAGVWSAMPTPFTDDLKLDMESVSRLVEHHVRLGIKGVLIAGLNGEGNLMTDLMKMELVTEVVKCNQGRILLSMMIMDSSAEMMLENIKIAQDCGIDIAMIGFPFTPLDLKPEYLRELYLAVLEKSPLPVSIQHINRPSSKSNEVKLFKELIMHPKVILLNDCSNDLDKIDMLLDAAEQRNNGLSVFTGSAFSCASYGELGYTGFLLASACFTGHIASEILKFVQAGRAKPAQMLQDYMNSLLLDILGLEFEHYLVGQKQMLVELGVFSTAKNLQDYPVPEDLVSTIKEIVEQDKEFLLPEINQNTSNPKEALNA